MFYFLTRSHYLVKSIPKTSILLTKMDPATTAVKKVHAGEIYATNNISVIFECKGCNEQFGIYTKFLDHIFGVHFEDWMATETPNMMPNKNEHSKEHTGAVRKYYAGVLYATSNLCILIECKLCEEKFRANTKFLDHIFEKHFEDCTGLVKPEYVDSENVNKEVQYLEIGRAGDGENSGQSDFTTEIIQPMDDDVAGTTGARVESQPNAGTEITFRKVRLFKGRTINHSLQRKHKCRICGFLVSGIYNLKGHEMRHSAIKPFACLECGKSFYTSTELNGHIRRHNGEKPYTCTYCGASYRNSSQLTFHEKRHTNDRRFKCDQCDKRFYDRRQLLNHSVVHTKERNYTCDECNAKFTRMNALRTHKKLHANALEYQCTICHMRFNQKPTLLWHRRTKHNLINNQKVDNSSERSSNLISIEYNST
ncbi:zinc finger protein 551-like isoform X2 [Eurosta solidaginis]|uniref:zinc finger protein 551-like isoform X2 n=1 Tax=Eurosta solidaginis TaxID=178769 RepID=UPI003531780E